MLRCPTTSPGRRITLSVLASLALTAGALTGGALAQVSDPGPTTPAEGASVVTPTHPIEQSPFNSIQSPFASGE